MGPKFRDKEKKPSAYAACAFPVIVHAARLSGLASGPPVAANKYIMKCLSGVVTIALGFVLCIPAEAQTTSGKPIGGVTTGEVVGVIVGVAAAVAVVTVVVIHESSKKRTITGCVDSAQHGMTLTDEKDKRSYSLSGDTTGIQPGERLTLQGKKIRPNGGKPVFWETKKITKDFGVCQPCARNLVDLHTTISKTR